MSCFQVKLGSEWKDYSKQEDKILKRAFLAGFPHARYSIRGQKYEVDFQRMQQKNFETLKDRQIRAPRKMKAPTKPICKPGPTMCIKVPAGSPGSVIQVQHPKVKGQFIAVTVPASAKVGQAMLVPVPTEAVSADMAAEAASPAVAAAERAVAAEPATAAPPTLKDAGRGWSTGTKVAAGTGGVVVVAGLAAAGALLGEHVAEDGWEATFAELGDDFHTVGDHISAGAEEAWRSVEGGAVIAGDHISDTAVAGWHDVVDAADEVGAFIMDLF